MNEISANPDEDEGAEEKVHSPELIATAWHEAGHAVVACLVGRPMQKVTIVAANLQTGGLRLGAVKLQKGRSKPTNDWVEDEVMILLAGMVAEAKVTEQYCQRGAANDLRRVQRLLSDRAGSEKKLEKLTRRMLDKTEYLLAEPATEHALRAIVAELLEKQTVSGRLIRHHVNQAAQKFS